tara:strand:- start:1453 stop:1734 length:282 start_codon:yes stop_codon:yes gene_type:complete
MAVIEHRLVRRYARQLTDRLSQQQDDWCVLFTAAGKQQYLLSEKSRKTRHCYCTKHIPPDATIHLIFYLSPKVTSGNKAIVKKNVIAINHHRA